MKTAICLSGQARFGTYAFRTLAENLLADLDCDAFLFLWRLPGQSDAQARDAAQEFIGRHVRIKDCVTSEQIDFPAKDYESRIYPGSNVFNIQSMFYAIKAADDLRLKHEREQGIQYECVIRSRADNTCLTPMDLRKYKSLLPHYVFVPDISYFTPGLNDTFAFGSPQGMERFCSAYSNLDDYFRRDKMPFNPHMMLLHHLMKSRTNFAYLSIPVELTREVTLSRVIEG